MDLITAKSALLGPGDHPLVEGRRRDHGHRRRRGRCCPRRTACGVLGRWTPSSPTWTPTSPSCRDGRRGGPSSRKTACCATRFRPCGSRVDAPRQPDPLPANPSTRPHPPRATCSSSRLEEDADDRGGQAYSRPCLGPGDSARPRATRRRRREHRGLEGALQEDRRLRRRGGPPKASLSQSRSPTARTRTTPAPRSCTARPSPSAFPGRSRSTTWRRPPAPIRSTSRAPRSTRSWARSRRSRRGSTTSPPTACRRQSGRTRPASRASRPWWTPTPS